MTIPNSETIKFAARLQLAIGEESLRGFAPQCDLSDGALRKYLKGETFPTLDRLYAIAKAGNVNPAWLATGEGPMRPGEAIPASPTTASQLEESLRKDETSADIGELLKITHTVLNSKTIYRKALESNIVAFGRGVETEMKMEVMEQEMKEIKTMLKEIRAAQIAAAPSAEQSHEKKSQAA